MKVGADWYDGSAQILPDDDPLARLRWLGRPVNDALLLLIGTQQLTIRVDLDGDPHYAALVADDQRERAAQPDLKPPNRTLSRRATEIGHLDERQPTQRFGGRTRRVAQRSSG